MASPKVILGIDPGFNSLGWATFEIGRSPHRLGDGWTFGYLKPSGKGIEPRLKSIGLFLDSLQLNVGHLVIEYPTFFNGEVGRVAARQGHTIMLGTLVGFVIGWLQVPASATTLYTPQQWKGSVSKEITQKKFLRLFEDGVDYPKLRSDAVDAVMLIRYHLQMKGTPNE